jgi:hypothetical protein
VPRSTAANIARSCGSAGWSATARRRRRSASDRSPPNRTGSSASIAAFAAKAST